MPGVEWYQWRSSPLKVLTSRENTPPFRLCSGGKETLDHMTNECPETEDIRQEYQEPSISQSFGHDLENKNKQGQFSNEVLRRLDNRDISKLFLFHCKIYTTERNKLYDTCSFTFSNFKALSDEEKLKYIMKHELYHLNLGKRNL